MVRLTAADENAWLTDVLTTATVRAALRAFGRANG
jgi:hypothetical protein